jgi:hypothetical protein
MYGGDRIRSKYSWTGPHRAHSSRPFHRRRAEQSSARPGLWQVGSGGSGENDGDIAGPSSTRALRVGPEIKPEFFV